MSSKFPIFAINQKLVRFLYSKALLNLNVGPKPKYHEKPNARKILKVYQYFFVVRNLESLKTVTLALLKMFYKASPGNTKICKYINAFRRHFE